MIQEKFVLARQLIHQRRYDEAMVVLRQIQHPHAKRWLAELESRTPSRKPRNLRLKLSVIVIGIMIVAGTLWLDSERAARGGAAANARFCATLYQPGTLDYTQCLAVRSR